MHNQKIDSQKDMKIVISWLAHHDPKRNDFNEHIIYIFNHAICLGCFAFYLSITVALILSNLFYNYISNFLSLPLIIAFFFICWIPSIIQYSFQILRKKPFKSRIIKFLTRFLYPLGSIIFIFKSPLWGFGLAIPAGYFILYIRNKKEKTLSNE